MKNSKQQGDPTEESIQKINNSLNDVYPVDEEMFMVYFDDMMERSINEPDFQEQAFRMEEFYGR
jgi:hypothetical protein